MSTGPTRLNGKPGMEQQSELDGRAEAGIDRVEAEAAEGEELAVADRARPGEWSGQHPINLRLSVPLPFFRFYVTIVAGRERRSPARRAEERRKHPILTAGNLFLMTYGGAVLAIALGAIAMLATLMVIQQLFEIEIFLS